MGGECWFYRDEREWVASAERLKQTPCPGCKAVGTLIRHGCLYGFDEESPRRKTVRARRIFCSNRHARPGCGRTFSVWLADKIRRLSLTSCRVWTFLKRAAAVGIAAAIRAADCHLCDRTLQRIWRRFDRGQSAIRTALFGRTGPPSKISEGYFRFLCPHCGEMRATVNPRSNLARCFCCKKNLNTIDLLISEGYDFLAAVALLKRWLDEYQANQPQTTAATPLAKQTKQSPPPTQ